MHKLKNPEQGMSNPWKRQSMGCLEPRENEVRKVIAKADGNSARKGEWTVESCGER